MNAPAAIAPTLTDFFPLLTDIAREVFRTLMLSRDVLHFFVTKNLIPEMTYLII